MTGSHCSTSFVVTPRAQAELFKLVTSQYGMVRDQVNGGLDVKAKSDALERGLEKTQAGFDRDHVRPHHLRLSSVRRQHPKARPLARSDFSPSAAAQDPHGARIDPCLALSDGVFSRPLDLPPLRSYYVRGPSDRARLSDGGEAMDGVLPADGPGRVDLGWRWSGDGQDQSAPGRRAQQATEARRSAERGAERNLGGQCAGGLDRRREARRSDDSRPSAE